MNNNIYFYVELKHVTDDIDHAFKAWYGNGYPEIIKPEIVTEFHKNIFPFLDDIAGKENRKLQENYFNNFTPIWNYFQNSGSSIDFLEWVWRVALEPIIIWERNSHKRIHKGSPYFYLGTSFIRNRNIEKGYISVHEAYNEDMISHDEEQPDKVGELPETPALALITIDPKEENYFRIWVTEIIGFLDKKIIPIFNNKYPIKINFPEIRAKFLTCPDLINLAYLFSYSISRVYDYSLNSFIYNQKNYLSTQITLQIFFDILRIVEGLIENKETEKADYFGNHLKFLRDKSNIYSLDDFKDKDKEFENFRKQDPEKAFSDLLSNNFVFSDGTSPTDIEKDLMIALGIRNYFAHNINPIDILYEKKYEIFDRLFHLMFAVIQYLY